MKHKIASTAVTTALLTFSLASSAAIFDFQQWIADNGEQGFTNSSPFTMTESGLTLTAMAFDVAGETTLASNVYMDDTFNGIIGGMGVCTTLTLSMQCDPSSDDNVSSDGGSAEILTWSFDQNISQIDLELGDSEHFDFNSTFEYSLNGGIDWLTAMTAVDGTVSLLLGGSSQIGFRTAGANTTDYFYIRNADVAVVPVPATAFLFGSGLLGLVSMARRRRT